MMKSSFGFFLLAFKWTLCPSSERVLKSLIARVSDPSILVFLLAQPEKRTALAKVVLNRTMSRRVKVDFISTLLCFYFQLLVTQFSSKKGA